MGNFVGNLWWKNDGVKFIANKSVSVVYNWNAVSAWNFLPLRRKKGGGEILYIWRDDVGFWLFTRWLSGRIKFIGLNLIFERNFFITIRIESKAPRDFSDLTVKQTNFYANFKISLQLLPHFMVIWFNGN